MTLRGTTGTAVRDGVRLHYEVFGSGETTVLLVPTWQILDSRFWKAQLGYLARRYRVVRFDARGSGRSDRPAGAAAYGTDECAADILAVLDATGTERAVLAALSCGVAWAVHAAAEAPDRVLGLFAIGPTCGFGIALERERNAWGARHPHSRGWASYSRSHWLEGDLDGFRPFFFGQMFTEPHSTKQIEDGVEWAQQATPQSLVDTTAGRLGCDGAVCSSIEAACARVRCPVTVLHGTDDRISALAAGERLAELTGGSLVTLEGSGHGPMARDPVRVNTLLGEFVDRLVPDRGRRRWTRAASRPKRALYLSSPIGLGHARRDLAIATELRKLHPDLELDWLAQDPVTAVLDGAGERVHPASAWLQSESAHVESEAGEHDLHAFQAIRRMDAVLVNNFMVFQDLVSDEHVDLVIADEAWDVDYFLHENPELKRFAFAWMTDFVGWLPMPDGGPAEAALTADYNAEMLQQRARYRRVRDRSVFVGNPADVLPDAFGPGLPSIRAWTEENFDFAGYVTGFDPGDLADREAVRRQHGCRPGEKLCVVAVGGSAVGAPLLHRVLEAVPLARHRMPDLRFVVVAGPRIDPRSLPRRRGAVVRGYLPDLHRLLAAADLGVVQGGLTTCMELTASRTPFLYVPLRNHFEQNLHVRHRLQQYGAGRCLDYDRAADPNALAAAIVAEVGREVYFRPVETHGAHRAATLLADLL